MCCFLAGAAVSIWLNLKEWGVRLRTDSTVVYMLFEM